MAITVQYTVLYFVKFGILYLCRRLLWMAQVSSWSPPFCSSCFAGRLISRAPRIGFYPGPARHLWGVCPGFGTWYLDGNSLTLSGDWSITEKRNGATKWRFFHIYSVFVLLAWLSFLCLLQPCFTVLFSCLALRCLCSSSFLFSFIMFFRFKVCAKINKRVQV